MVYPFVAYCKQINTHHYSQNLVSWFSYCYAVFGTFLSSNFMAIMYNCSSSRFNLIIVSQMFPNYVTAFGILHSCKKQNVMQRIR